MNRPQPIEYAEASPEVRAVFDDIKARRKVQDVNNFWKYLAMIQPCSRASGGMLARAIGVYRDHFHGANYATLDSPGIIMQLHGDGATLVGNGWIQAASERHLLITERDGLMVEVIERARMLESSID